MYVNALEFLTFLPKLVINVCLSMSKRSLFVRLVPCRCLRGEEETITSLDYSHCSLETVPKEIFSFEKTLQELYLDANQIEELPKQLFNCQLLHRLSLPDNDLTVLPAGIANLVNLRELDVSKNSIQEFPENIKNCKVLTIVEASVNPISKLPEGFTQLLSLTQLYLNDAFLEFLPASFGRLTKLQILELRENQLKMLPKLTFLPGMLGMLKQLTYLDVSKNNIEMVDEQISGCENLQDLLISNNALVQLPGSIGSLKKLTALKVDENQLVQLPDSIGGMESLEELDCSFNEIEDLPSSIGQCDLIRTFAADHNFLSQLPPSATVLFLHSNKLESLPEEMGDMQRLKVINLSNNKLKSLPYSFTKLNQMTAMWLSENQSKALIPLQKEEDPETQKTVLTNYMFPQQTKAEDYIPNSDSESFNPALWEEQRKHRAQVAFECDEDKDERETPPREGNLKRYPTPYPEELKNMVKTAQSVAHRLKEEESNDESKHMERNHIGLQNVGVKVIEAPCPNGVTAAVQEKMSPNAFPEDASTPESQDTSESYNSHKGQFKSSEELFEEEEMKVAEMRPPLMEISINQPKVVTLNDLRDADSLLDDTVANSNQNNSNCSSPSRMSDSVSLTTDSSQDNSLCTPEREAKMAFLPKIQHEDENMNQPKETTPFLHNGNGSDTYLPALTQTQQSQPRKGGDYDLSVEARLTTIEKEMDNGIRDKYSKWDHINMNISTTTDDIAKLDDLETSRNGQVQDDINTKKSSMNDYKDYLHNGNQQVIDGLSLRSDAGVAVSSDLSLSRSTEELSPEKRCYPPQVMKSHSISNIETGGIKMFSFEGESDRYDVPAVSRASGAGAQGQSIVRSKSASLLNDQPLQVYPSSSTSSSGLLSSSKPSRGHGYPPPQYNVQYTNSALPNDGMWGQRQPNAPCMPTEHQGYLPPPPHSLANTNYSNRNQAPPYPLQSQQRAPPMVSKLPVDMWSKDRLPSTGGQPRSSTLQRQGSSASNVSIGDPRRVQLPEGDYMTYRDIHTTFARGPLAMSHSMQRPLSARTYSIDGPGAARSYSARPQPQELPERTMSVSDFNYQHTSPSKRPNTRVNSEHSLLDGPVAALGSGRVPADWRDQVMRHIEAKKMEKVSTYMSCIISQSDEVFVQGQQSFTMDPHRKVPLINGQMGSSGRSQPPVTRHPSREQLIDFLMLKVSHQPQGHSRIPHETLHQEIHVKVEKNPELGFSISGGVGGRGNPFRPDDYGIFITRVQPEGPASKILQPGDKILQANGYSFVNIDHGNAVSLLKTFSNTVELTIVREMQA
uniref:Erbb2 interacting protein n=1 Tax=Neogobius melanostomus TaxID=47308 RepID=A0A8C6UC92_9GOBI